MFAMQPIDVGLKAVAPVFVFAHALAGEFQAALEILDLARRAAPTCTRISRSDLLALDHAGVRIRIARHAQPVRAQPDAVARDHRFARRSSWRRSLQRLAQGLCGVHRRQHRAENRRALHLRLQRGGIARSAGVASPSAHHRQMAAVEARQQIGDAVQAVDAHRLEIGSQDRFDGPLPAPIDPQLLRDARLAIQRLRLEPLRDLAGHFAERRLLQRLGRHLRAQRLLPARAQGVERLRSVRARDRGSP